MGVLPVGPGAMSRPFRAPGHGRGRALFHPCILSLGAGGKEQVGWAGSVLVSVGEGRGGPACPSRCDLMGGGRCLGPGLSVSPGVGEGTAENRAEAVGPQLPHRGCDRQVAPWSLSRPRRLRGSR